MEDLELIEFERKDGSKVVAEMDGDKIKSLKYVYEYENTEEANNNLETVKEKNKDVKYIEEIKVNENKVEVIIEESAYKDLTLEEVMEKFFVDIDEESGSGEASSGEVKIPA